MATTTGRGDGWDRAAGFAAMALATLTCLGGCEDVPYYASAYATVEAREVRWEAQADGTATLDVTLVVHLETYEEKDDVALDDVTLQVDATPVEIVEVDVADGDWPVHLEAYASAERTVRVRAHAAAQPTSLPGPCATTSLVDATVTLLVNTGTTQGYAATEISRTGEGSRIGLVRSGSEVSQEYRDPYVARPQATIDGAGTVWVVDRDEGRTTSSLWSRTADGVVSSVDVSGAATVAPGPDGVFVVEALAGHATVSYRRSLDDVDWSVELDSEVFQAGVTVPVGAAAGRVVVAVPGHGSFTTAGESVWPAIDGTFLVELDETGTMVAIDMSSVFGVYLVAVSEQSTVVATYDSVAAVRGGETLWSTPYAVEALALAGEDIVITGMQAVLRLGPDGSWRQSSTLLGRWPMTSLGVRADGEILVGSSYGSGARIAADGTVLYEGAIACEGAIAFGGSQGRVAYAASFRGREGWGDAPDRDVPTPVFALGEVLP